MSCLQFEQPPLVSTLKMAMGRGREARKEAATVTQAKRACDQAKKVAAEAFESVYCLRKPRSGLVGQRFGMICFPLCDSGNLGQTSRMVVKGGGKWKWTMIPSGGTASGCPLLRSQLA